MLTRKEAEEWAEIAFGSIGAGILAAAVMLAHAMLFA